MNILVVGGGGREHALAWKLSQTPVAESVYVAPGNAGTEAEPGLENVSIAADNIDALVRFALAHKIDLTVVGPEQPLVAGIVDRFYDAGLRCFGPSAEAAELEGSKRFTKDFLARFNIPTATYESFTEIDPAIAYIRQQGAPIVIKADGLAAGKGVILAQTEKEATTAVRDMLAGNAFGAAGHCVVIEAFLTGEEASFICMVDGSHVLPLATSQDHKTRDNGDTGPNTGGMGAYSPAPVVTEEMHQRIMNEVILPTVEGMKELGRPYTGFLYAGVMIDADGTPNVLEYNCRFGDPETQPIMMRLQSDLAWLCDMALDGKLDKVTAQWDERKALGVVLAAGGYPDSYNSGDIIDSLPENTEDMHIFHAGTATQGNKQVTSGGRVLCVTALGDSVTEAQHRAYETVKQVHWDNVYYRTDIGHRAISREALS
ncbi:phosphoribosylamine--glycine ligase [bacterium BMS3Bbin11]|nr:phosphoribosylamine--glycine ligase [bacterium BMS3Bbin11]HDH14897.1 phosphoribosylamine--glycine ligase [Gammaproteobacteria bacterium]